MKKKVVAILMTATMAIALAACGSSASNASSAAASAASEEAASATEEAASAAEEAASATEEAASATEEAASATEEAASATEEAASTEEAAPAGDNLDGTGLTIGMIMPNLENSVYASMKTSGEEKAKELGAEFQFVAEMEVPGHIDAMESMIESGVDIIITHAIYEEAIHDTIQAAVDKGIKVYAFDTVSDAAVRSYVADNYITGQECGRMLGEWINEVHGGEAKVGIFSYSQLQDLADRCQGMKDGLAEVCPGAEIVMDAESYTVAMGTDDAENFLQAEPDIKAIMAFTDSSGLGGYEAFKGHDLNNDEHAIFSVDGSAEAMQAIAENGCYRGTVYMGLASLGAEIVEDAVRIQNGGEVGDPVSYWVHEPVTQENVQDYLGK